MIKKYIDYFMDENGTAIKHVKVKILGITVYIKEICSDRVIETSQYNQIEYEQPKIGYR